MGGITVSVFPFDAVVGQDDAKLALRLAAADPLIGGVLLRGQKGSAKTTLARGLAGLLGDAPFVELPLGATEDRVVGTLDTHAALTGGEVRFQAGLLATAHGGVLYVDEINLLADHLVDVLLDVAVSGENVVERDGISHRHPARFVLVGSMNPEEGELRPQLLDRFGLCVEVTAPLDIGARTESVRRRLAFDAGSLVEPSASAASAVRGGPEPAALTDEIIEAASRLAVEVGAEGLRADLVLCRAAAGAAGLDDRSQATIDDLRRVAPLVLAHRSRRGPFDPPVIGSDELERAMDEALDPPEPTDDSDPDDRDGRSSAEPGTDTDSNTDGQQDDAREGTDGAPEQPSATDTAQRPLLIGARRRPPISAAVQAESTRGRVVGDRGAESGDRDIAVMATVRALAGRRATDPTAVLQAGDLRSPVRAATKSRTIVLAVDLSGSMGAPDRAQAASGTVIGLLADAYQRRDRVALVGFRGEGAEVLLSRTSSVEVARNRLDGLLTGGPTPLAAGILAALDLADAAVASDSDALLVLLTDGRATGAADALDQAMEAAATVRRRAVSALVLDCETGHARLGLAADLARAMGARHIKVTNLDPAALTEAIRGQR